MYKKCNLSGLAGKIVVSKNIAGEDGASIGILED